MKAEFLLARSQLQFSAAVGFLLVLLSGFIFSDMFLGSSEDSIAQTKARVAEVLESLVEYERHDGLNNLIRLINERRVWGGDDALFVSIKHPSGATILHTSNDVSAREAWAVAASSIRSRTVGIGWFVRHVYVATSPLKAGTLLVGLSETNEAQRRDWLFTGFLVSLAAAVALVWVLVVLLSMKSRKYVDEMKSILYAFAAGEVERRVMIPSVNTPLADLAHAINASLDYSRTLIQNLNNTSSDIAHNLKKPLTRLRQRLELASKCEAGNPEFSAKVDEGIQEIDSLVAMFEALLNFGQLQSGDWRSRFVDVDMGALLAQISDIYEPIAADHGHKLVSYVSMDRVRPVRGARELLMEMIVNLLENAIQYCPSGTTIHLGMEQRAKGLDVVVCDNGPGVPVSEIENLFRRFYRLEASRDKPGHGLGIPFAVAIAELHGGRIELSDNKPGLHVLIHFPNVPETPRPQPSLRLRSVYVVKGLTKRWT